MDIKFDDKTPIYLQIMEMIKKDVVSKKLREGDKLPSVRELAGNLKVNPNTLQRAYQELEREGITFTQRGMGTFITEDEGVINNLKKEMAHSVIVSFIEGMKELGFSSSEIIDIISEQVKREE